MGGTILHTLIFAEVIGLYLMITSIIMLSRADHYRAMIAKLKPTDPVIAIGASVTLFFSLFLVVMHNVWSYEPRTLVTVVSWLIVLKAVIWLASPEQMLGFLKKICKTRAYFVMNVLFALLGVIMLSRGYCLFSNTTLLN